MAVRLIGDCRGCKRSSSDLDPVSAFCNRCIAVIEADNARIKRLRTFVAEVDAELKGARLS